MRGIVMSKEYGGKNGNAQTDRPALWAVDQLVGRAVRDLCQIEPGGDEGQNATVPDCGPQAVHSAVEHQKMQDCQDNGQGGGIWAFP